MASPPSSSHQLLITDQTTPPNPEDASSASSSAAAAAQTSRQDAAPPVEIQEIKPAVLDDFEDADIADYMEKHKKYETLYARRLKAKYFSKKAFNGGDIFDHETTIDDEIIKSSRWPCTRSFADPMQDLGHPSRSPSSSPETSAAAHKKHTSNKSC